MIQFLILVLALAALAPGAGAAQVVSSRSLTRAAQNRLSPVSETDRAATVRERLRQTSQQIPRTPAGPLVISERWPQTTDLASWTRDVMRLEHVEHASDTAQARAFFEWLRLFSRMAIGGMIQAYEGDYGREHYVTDANKNLFVYGWGFCDTSSRIAEAAWKEYKNDARAASRVCVQHADGGYHTMYRLLLNGRYAAFDPRYGYYLIDHDAPDARILDWAEVGVNANILKNRNFANHSRPFFEIFGLEWDRALLLQPVYFESERAWRAAGAPKESVFGDSQYQMDTRFHDMSFRLPKGTSVERFWDNSAREFYVPAAKAAQREFPFLPTGRFYRVTEASLNGNWPKYDPNYKKAEPYLVTVPSGEGYSPDMAGKRSIGQAWGRIRYTPDLRGGDFTDALAPGATLVHAKTAPYLRPRETGGGGEATFDFYSPYVLVDGALTAKLAGDGVKLEIRTLAPKPAGEADPDVWSRWQTLDFDPRGGAIQLGRPRYNGRDVSIDGTYRFQIRVSVSSNANPTAPAGLNSFGLQLYFENGIMSIPQIFAGRNTIHFKLDNAANLRAPVRVTYTYQTAAGERSQVNVLRASDFHGNTAQYSFAAPGLIRCKSLVIAY